MWISAVPEFAPRRTTTPVAELKAIGKVTGWLLPLPEMDPYCNRIPLAGKVRTLLADQLAALLLVAVKT